MTTSTDRPTWRHGFSLARATGRVVPPFDATEAAARHRDGRPYAAVLVDQRERPLGAVETALCAGRVDVLLYDGRGRPAVERCFVPSTERAGWLFERALVRHSYPDDSERRPSATYTFSFGECGSVVEEVDTRSGEHLERVDLLPTGAADLLYEPMPRFDGLASLLREDRGAGVDGQRPGSAVARLGLRGGRLAGPART